MSDYNNLKEKAKEILDFASLIYNIQEKENSYAIMSDNETLYINCDGKIETYIDDDYHYWVARYNEYYFEYEGMVGKIKRARNVDVNDGEKYSLEVALEIEPRCWFAKIRIYYSSHHDIQIKGGPYGPPSDFDDINLLGTEDIDRYLDLILQKISLMYRVIVEDGTVNKFDDHSQKEIIKARERDVKDHTERYARFLAKYRIL